MTDRKIKEHKHYFLKLSEIVSGPFGSTLKSESYLQEGIPFIRIENIRGGFNINTSNMVYISEQDNNKISNSQLNIDDIILSKVGNSIGYFARVGKNLGVCNISENNIGIRTKNYSESEKTFILTYLNCKYAKALVLRRTSGNAQPKLNVSDLCYIPIPVFSDVFYSKIREKVLNSQNKILEADSTYECAESILNKYLNVAAVFENGVTVKTLSNSFIRSGRMDAEYYQPKYEKIQSQLKSTKPLFMVCKLYDSNFVPDNNAQYDYIELSNVGLTGDISNIDKVDGGDLPSRARRMVKEGQIIVSSIEGSLSSCALIGQELDGAICSTGFYVVDSNEINSETLLMLFKSMPIQALLQQHCSGTILTAISKEEFLNIPIPYIDDTTQKEISDRVQESFYLRKEAKRLLDNAIKAVEMAIETNENTALLWIESQQ